MCWVIEYVPGCENVKDREFDPAIQPSKLSAPYPFEDPSVPVVVQPAAGLTVQYNFAFDVQVAPVTYDPKSEVLVISED